MAGKTLGELVDFKTGRSKPGKGSKPAPPPPVRPPAPPVRKTRSGPTRAKLLQQELAERRPDLAAAPTAKQREKREKVARGEELARLAVSGPEYDHLPGAGINPDEAEDLARLTDEYLAQVIREQETQVERAARLCFLNEGDEACYSYWENEDRILTAMRAEHDRRMA